MPLYLTHPDPEILATLRRVAEHVGCEVREIPDVPPEATPTRLTLAEGIAELAALDRAWRHRLQIRRNEDGTVDEVVGPCQYVHLEQMSAGCWSLIIDDLYLTLSTSRRSRAPVGVTVVEGE